MRSLNASVILYQNWSTTGHHILTLPWWVKTKRPGASIPYPRWSIRWPPPPRYSNVGRLTLTYSDVFKRIQTYADLRWRIETYADALLHSTIRCIWGVRKSPPYGRAQRLTPSKCTLLGKIIQNFKKIFDRFYWENRNEKWGHHRRITSHEVAASAMFFNLI